MKTALYHRARPWITAAIAVLPVSFVYVSGSSDADDSAASEYARHDYPWSFPRDHGHHRSYETEWWYYTGQLYGASKEPFRDRPVFGYQLTFFRRRYGTDRSGNDGYLAHAAVADLAAGRCVFSTRSGGGELNLAGSIGRDLKVWAGGWSAERIGDVHSLRFDLPETTSAPRRWFSILARFSRGPWLQGDKGFSRKATCERCASMYYSLPHMTADASLFTGSESRSLHGIGWMDHEFMTNSLSPEQAGWDWLGLMFRDGSALTVFRLRRRDGSVDFASGSLRKGEESVELSESDFTLSPNAVWKSPKTGAGYPLEWRIEVPKSGISAVVRSRVPDCEIGNGDVPASTIYWEGPVAASDESVLGYLEMTGYAGDVTL